MRILLVEDDSKIARAIKKGLEQENFAVDIAHDYHEGIGLALTQEYDALIIDRMLPGKMDGAQICKEMRRKKIQTPILILTARAEITDRVEGFEFGADDYLVKPFAFEELLARIRALLRRPEKMLPEVLEVDDLKLDTKLYRVERGGVEIILSRTEFALLEYLMRNKGIILSKEKIMSHVWDYDSDVLLSSVEVYISYLRSKIEKPFKDKKKLIHTIRGFGYMLGDKL